MDKSIARELRLKQWAEDLADYEASGLSQKKWCKLHNIPDGTFAYRNKVLREEIENREHPTLTEKSSYKQQAEQIVEVPMHRINPIPAVTTNPLRHDELITIEISNAKITLPLTVDPYTLKSIFGAIINV